MIRRLRVRFVCVNMAIVLVMLCAMFATVYALTQKDVENRSRDFLRAAVEDPDRAEHWAERDAPHPPYLLLEVDQAGEVSVLFSGGLSVEGQEEMETLAARTEGQTEGVLRDMHLRFSSRQSPEGRRLAVGYGGDAPEFLPHRPPGIRGLPPYQHPPGQMGCGAGGGGMAQPASIRGRCLP